MSIFLSSFPGSIDKKNRISIPSNYKNTIKDSKQKIYLFKSLKNSCLEIYLEAKINSIINSVEEEDFFSTKKDDLRTAILSDLEEISFDSDGRFILKDDQKKFSKISKDIIYIGKGNYFEIWDFKMGIKNKERARKSIIK
ncbi:MAG: hypothetical protein P8J53_01895 [Alphaproteobacteria bacterium]|jgi:MraZ protein|nr:hypothetical protein [Alphaproteobacteria bacterium]